MRYNLRPATWDDIDELEARYEQVMRPYVELTHTWNIHQFRKKFTVSGPQVVTVQGKIAGYYFVKEGPFKIYLGDIQIWPEYQGHGIGTSLLHTLIARANHLGLPIHLKVLKGNPAINLYLSLGFSPTDEPLDNSIGMIKIPAQ